MTKKLTICVDLDDTLIPNTYKYHRPIWRCGQIIAEALGNKSPYPLALLQLHSETDQAMVKAFGFGTGRFPKSWVRTYEILCEREKIAPDDKVRKRLLAAASRFKYGPFTPFGGAADALREVRKDGHGLHLITAGDEKLQRRKVRQCGLAALFDSVNITGIDKKAVMERIAGSDPGSAVMVGDSKKSDLKPAIELGMTAVWIPSQTWTFAQTDLEPGSFLSIASIEELPELIRGLASGGQARENS